MAVTWNDKIMRDAMVSSDRVYFKNFPKLLLKNSFLWVIQLE